MVTVINYQSRKSDTRKELFALTLQGEPEFIRSVNTGKLYLTAKSASILTTFEEGKCQNLIGITFPGSIIKVQCDEYTYTLPETGEDVKLNFRYEYSEEASNMEEVVFEAACK